MTVSSTLTALVEAASRNLRNLRNLRIFNLLCNLRISLQSASISPRRISGLRFEFYSRFAVENASTVRHFQPTVIGAFYAVYSDHGIGGEIGKRCRVLCQKRFYMLKRIAGWIVALIWFAGIESSSAQNVIPEQITPPFGFHWGESEKQLETTISRAEAHIVNREVIQGRDAWTVEGLLQPSLKRTIIYFGTEKTLVEVELQYQRPEWDLVAYEDFLNSARQKLEAKYRAANCSRPR